MNGWLAADGCQDIGAVLLVGLLISAAWIDIRERRIPNVLVFSGAMVALLFAHLPGGSVGSFFAGIAVGVAMTLPLYWLRTMGAGDVKLMGMVGSFLGAGDVFAASLVIFVVGGALGLLAAARLHVIPQLGDNLKEMLTGGVANVMTGSGPPIEAPIRSVGVQPYGVAIAIGTVLYLAAMKGGIFQ